MVRRRRCRRPAPLVVVVLVLGCSMISPLSGCGGNRDQLQESRRLIAEGTALRDEGWRTGNSEKQTEGQILINRGKRLRAEALEGM